MAEIIVMPKLGLLMETGTLSTWRVKEGDPVSIGDVIAEITTEKITYELESEAEGVLLKIILAEDEEAPVGKPIAIVGRPGEDISRVTVTAENGEESEAVTTATELPTSAGNAVQESKVRVIASPAAKKLADALNLEISKITGTGPKGRVTLADVKATALVETSEEQIPTQERTEKAETSGKSSVFATPTAKKMAAELGIDLAGIIGSGFHNRIRAEDVAAAAAQNPCIRTKVQTDRALGERLSVDTDDIRGGVAEEIPYAGMRRLIGEHMQASRQLSPTVTYDSLADVQNLKEMLEQVNAKCPAYDKLSITAAIIKAVALTLRRMPRLNATLEANTIKVWRNINIGLAVALDDGLIAPVIREADRKRMCEIGREIRDLSYRAREKKLLPDEVRGSTFTVSNLGPYESVDFFNPIINQPEAAILGAGRMKDTVVAVEGKPAVHATMGLSLTCDHRMLDGAPTAEFLRILIDYLETPSSMLV